MATPAQELPQGISLLDLAEILDQHKEWVESGGQAGAKADLCGADLGNADLTGLNLQGAFLHKTNLRGADLSLASLRGASLVQADLRDTNLLGTELRGANLMGARLYGADGLWVGRLGGANLFDAMLPESIAAFDGPKAVAQASRMARWTYFMMLATIIVCCVLVGFTTDAKLLLDSSAIPLQRFSHVLPMSGFYLGAPLFLFLVYLRFHFLLLRLWGNMAALPAVFPDGQSLDKDGPWYLMGLVRRHFRWARDTKSPLPTLESVLATILAYWFVPLTIFLLWLRYLARQDFRGTLLHIALIMLCVAAATGLPTLVTRVLRPGDLHRPKTKNVVRLVLSTLRVAIATGVVLLLLSLGIIRGVPPDANTGKAGNWNVRQWASRVLQLAGYRPYADVTEASFSTVLPGPNASDDALPPVRGARMNQANLRYARGYHVFLVNARLWHANLEGAYLSEADLRGANLRDALLKNAVLDRIQASRATLVSADVRGANLSAADLRGADLSYGILSDAVLSNAKLSGASMYAVDLRGAKLLRADLSRADLRDARLENATLSLANLQEADFSAAKLIGTDLREAQLKGGIFLDAKLTNADLRGALLTGAIVRDADFQGANVGSADLRGAVGLTAAQLCSGTGWQTAQLDADLLASTQQRCGPPAAAPVASPRR
jgi:uncharacterized protein YjbI with pentapeptide repeats